MNSLVVDFLTREGCHLCDEARRHVRKAARRAALEVQEVDIDSDDRLVGVYGLRIPVLLAPDGAVIAEGELTSTAELVRLFREWKRPR